MKLLKANAFYLVFLTFLFIVASCDFKQSQIDSLANEISMAEEDVNDVNEKEWQNLAQEIEELEVNLNQNRKDFTEEQIREINQLKGKYAALVVKRGMLDLKNGINDFQEQIKGFVEEIKSDSLNK